MRVESDRPTGDTRNLPYNSSKLFYLYHCPLPVHTPNPKQFPTPPLDTAGVPLRPPCTATRQANWHVTRMIESLLAQSTIFEISCQSPRIFG